MNRLKKVNQDAIGLLKTSKVSLKVSILIERAKILIYEKYSSFKRVLVSQSKSEETKRSMSLKDHIEQAISKNLIKKEKIELEKKIWRNKCGNFRTSFTRQSDGDSIEHKWNDVDSEREDINNLFDASVFTSKKGNPHEMILTPIVISEINSDVLE